MKGKDRKFKMSHFSLEKRGWVGKVGLVDSRWTVGPRTEKHICTLDGDQP